MSTRRMLLCSGWGVAVGGGIRGTTAAVAARCDRSTCLRSLVVAPAQLIATAVSMDIPCDEWGSGKPLGRCQMPLLPRQDVCCPAREATVERCEMVAAAPPEASRQGRAKTHRASSSKGVSVAPCRPSQPPRIWLKAWRFLHLANEITRAKHLGDLVHSKEPSSAAASETSQVPARTGQMYWIASCGA